MVLMTDGNFILQGIYIHRKKHKGFLLFEISSFQVLDNATVESLPLCINVCDSYDINNGRFSMILTVFPDSGALQIHWVLLVLFGCYLNF